MTLVATGGAPWDHGQSSLGGLFGPSGPIVPWSLWVPLGPSGSLWPLRPLWSPSPLVPRVPLVPRKFLVPFGPLWFPLVPFGPLWFPATANCQRTKCGECHNCQHPKWKNRCLGPGGTADDCTSHCTPSLSRTQALWRASCDSMRCCTMPGGGCGPKNWAPSLFEATPGYQ